MFPSAAQHIAICGYARSIPCQRLMVVFTYATRRRPQRHDLWLDRQIFDKTSLSKESVRKQSCHTRDSVPL